jgi:pseudouridine-5'-phosphate glycosidase
MQNSIVTHPEVASALAEDRPVVALESTVITHGLPNPLNLELAQDVEVAVRAAGATPATIALLGGEIHVGLTSRQMSYLASRPLGAVRKCSRRDLPLAMAQQLDGGTTVAGTMIIAHLAGIELFATGGIGGVHRGHPFDVSADLLELGRTPVTVVSSGAKSILDLALTREVLETNGVPIIGYQTDEMPAFFSRSSGHPVDICVHGPQEVAAIIHARRRLGLKSGTLLTVPVPAEDECDAQLADEAATQAQAEADAAGISGAAATPWLLRRVSELTGGQSLRANLSLLRNNARVAASVAAALAAFDD